MVAVAANAVASASDSAGRRTIVTKKRDGPRTTADGFAAAAAAVASSGIASSRITCHSAAASGAQPESESE